MSHPHRPEVWIEVVLWVLVVVLVSPLVAYAGEPTVPVVGMYAVAGGIALALALAGRRLHDAMLRDVLGGRSRRGRAVLAVGMILMVVLLVLSAAVVAIVLMLRSLMPPPLI